MNRAENFIFIADVAIGHKGYYAQPLGVMFKIKGGLDAFDAAATPMFNSFATRPDNGRYKCEPARVNLEERNQKTAWGADLSRTMDFTKEDAADDLLLNEIVWRNVKGADSPMPAPKRAAFFLAHKKGADDDDD